jgi:hypothetical protein
MRLQIVIDDCKKFSEHLFNKYNRDSYLDRHICIEKINYIIYKEFNRYYQILIENKNIRHIITDKSRCILISELLKIFFPVLAGRGMFYFGDLYEEYFDIEDDLQLDMINFYQVLFERTREQYFKKIIKQSYQFRNKSSDILNLIYDFY